MRIEELKLLNVKTAFAIAVAEWADGGFQGDPPSWEREPRTRGRPRGSRTKNKQQPAQPPNPKGGQL